LSEYETWRSTASQKFQSHYALMVGVSINTIVVVVIPSW
jgi:hypothetical protein